MIVILALTLTTHAQKMKTDQKPTATVSHVNDFPIADLSSPNWRLAKEIEIGTYWSGNKAPDGRHFRARLLWSDTALYVRFDAVQTEPLVVSDKPELGAKTMKLWDRDVCEIFIAPDEHEPRKYFEFEIAPNGEWIDLTIDLTSGERVTGWDFKSGMQSAAKIESETVTMTMKVEWRSLGRMPKTGDVWLGNLFRCIGKDPNRGYLAWQPTLTKEPAFHIPEKFGQFHFVN